MAEAAIIVWLRNDLRLADHPALHAAVSGGARVVPLYILDDAADGPWRVGGASRWWLHHSLEALQRSIAAVGGRLVLRRGDTLDQLVRVATESKARVIHCTRSYEPLQIALEERLNVQLKGAGLSLKRFGGRLLREPEEVRTKDGLPFKVYTPFWRALSADWSASAPLPAPEKIASPSQRIDSEPLDNWKLLPRRPNWAKDFADHWTPGEAGASSRLEAFVGSALEDYATLRNRPDLAGTSRLSPHLHFGEISARTCWHRVAGEGGRRFDADQGTMTFLKELVWREFSAHLLFHFPTLPDKPFRKEFTGFPWGDDDERFQLWQMGRTGYPIVDAGMRELWQTGWMHNRVRMIVASFLVKDLLIPWQRGEAWFWDTLLDADLANNAASWQWVAGSGADAAPYFRIFNPVKQGATFDPDGAYVRRYVPELAALSADHIHAPWLVGDSALAKAGICLGENYPRPMIDHGAARERALNAFQKLKTAG